MNLSVIICTHNPRKDYLERTLNALKAQTLPREQWELLLIDNASQMPLAGQWDLSWHPQSRIVLEPELGILPCRVRGMKESCTPFILFVDDDNLLAPDYLELALKIAETHPFLGAWGGGISPEFETLPPAWIYEYQYLLACVEVPEDRWSNLKFVYATMPPTAGICLRRSVVEAFIRMVNKDPRRQLLGRRGKAGLTNCEDLDLALTACDIGLGLGQFARLKMTHLIPSSRLDEDYLLRFYEGTMYSMVILEAFRGRFPIRHHSSPLRTMLGKLRRRLFWNRRRRMFFNAQIRALRRADKIVASWR
jgi:glycosyltransferase involved in cell wall biosynthesis